MEFENLQQIWSEQHNERLYVINEKAMEKLIRSRKRTTDHITNLSELLLIVVHLLAGTFVLITNPFWKQVNIPMLLLAGWMLLTAIYTLVGRLRRISGRKNFGRSMLGDLDHAIATASYQVRLSHIMRWNIVPIAFFVVLGMWTSGKPLWISLVLVTFFSLSLLASGWEHNIYKRKKRELETLRKKLTEAI